VKKLSKAWPFKSDVDAFVGRPCANGSKPPFHSFYADNFNLVDRFNRYYYQLQYPHKQLSSGPVRMWGLITLVFLQSYFVYCEANSLQAECFTLAQYTREYVDTKLA